MGGNMKINEGQLVLLMKFSEIFLKSPIENHIEVLQKSGFVWYGKLGTKPSDKTIKSILFDNKYHIILHSVKGDSFLCEAADVITSHPKDNYPKYYDEIESLKNKPFKCYFKLVDIIKLEDKFLREYVLASTGEPAGNSLRNSMASIFILRKR